MKPHQLIKTKVLAPLTFLILSAPSTSYAASFYADFQAYNGSGLSHTPAVGELDSNYWAVSGMSDGDVNFGGACNTGDCARGYSTGGVSIGGLYAFDTDLGNRIFGMQPGASDLTPGLIVLRIRNETGTTVSQVGVEYDIWTLNNGDRSSSLNLSYSLNDIDYTPVTSLDFSTPESDDSSSWAATPMSTTISGLNISDADYFYLRWTTDDVDGLGARDEFGLDNISVSAVPIPAAVWLFGSGLLGLVGVARRKKA